MFAISHFMDNQNEVEIADEDIQEEDFSPEVLESDDTDWKAEALKAKGIAKRRATKLAKLKAIPKVEPKTPPEPLKKPSSELDYTQLGYLAAKGIEDDDSIAFIQSVALKTGDNLRTILNDDFVKSKLAKIKENASVLAATPSASKRGDTSTSRDKVEYWLAKGEMPPKDNVKLCREYVNAKLQKETDGNKFTDTPIVR
jgi:hypothetical protein